MAFHILYSPDCVASLNKRRIKHSLEARLSNSPFEFGKPLRHSAYGFWSLRVGDWRVIYKVNEQQVLVIKIGHRREVYKLL